ncbi:MAG: Retron-type RNA-directed DNA polymerase [Firmicutes bacterium]|nr:Retron-type RNA-directed DNA polymerase [Bacillota bacterium]
MQGIHRGRLDWTVDIDLAKYFDTVNHDKLMGLIHKTIKDKGVISLIRKFLQITFKSATIQYHAKRTG